MFKAEVAPHMPEGLTVVASRHLEMSDGRYPIAWVDSMGNMLPVEKHTPLSILPSGAQYLFDEDDIREASGARVYTQAAPTIQDRAAMEQATGAAPAAVPSARPEVSRAQALSAFNSVLGSPTHMVR